jgi:hypothetical protein
MNPIKWHEKRLKTGMSVNSEILLDRVGQSPIKISDLMKWGSENSVCSFATLHKEIHALINLGYASITLSEKDTRIKTLNITKEGKKYLEE